MLLLDRSMVVILGLGEDIIVVIPSPNMMATEPRLESWVTTVAQIEQQIGDTSLQSSSPKAALLSKGSKPSLSVDMTYGD